MDCNDARGGLISFKAEFVATIAGKNKFMPFPWKETLYLTGVDRRGNLSCALGLVISHSYFFSV